jgi:hypothetical protein
MALMLSPDPMPVEVTAALPAAPADVAEAAVELAAGVVAAAGEVALDMVELMAYPFGAGSVDLSARRVKT